MFQVPSSKFQGKNGFFLIEILIAVFVFAIILSIAIVVGRNFNNAVNLENTGKIVETKIGLAKARSISSLNGANYGIHFESDRIVIFAGGAFIAGAPTNEVSYLPDNIIISTVSLNEGGSDIVFGRLTGATNNFGAIDIEVASDPSKTKQIVVNPEGQVSFSSFQTSFAAPIANARHVHFALGWNIQNASILRLKWVDAFDNIITVNDIDAAPYFNGDKSAFDWQGETIVGASAQALRIRSWLDADGNTALCVTRDQTETEKLYIYFVDGEAKEIAIYARNDDGAVSVETGFYGGVMDIR